MCSSSAAKAVSNVVERTAKSLLKNPFQGAGNAYEVGRNVVRSSMTDPFKIVGEELLPDIHEKMPGVGYLNTDDEEGPDVTVTPEVDPNAGGDEEDDEDAPELNSLLGRLAAGRRTMGQGRGIGANILSGGSGVQGGARTRRRTLLG